MMLARVIVRVVDAEDHGNVFVGGRCGDDRFFCSGIEMSPDVSGVGKNTRRFDGYIDAELSPG
jgi:hypothetical protein